MIDPNKFVNQRKRSSLKTHIFPEGMSYEEYVAHKTKKLQWDTKAEEIVIDEPTDKMVVEGSNEDNVKAQVDRFSKLNIKKKKSDKKIYKITELEKEENDQNNDEENEEVIKEIEVRFDENNNVKFEKMRKQSIKDEFSLVKDLLKAKILDEEFDTDDKSETAKNTHHNENIGLYEDDSEDSD